MVQNNTLMSSVSAEKQEAFMVEYSLENKEQFFDEMAYQLKMFGITEFQKSNEFIDALVRSYQGAYVTQSPIGVLPEAIDVSLLPAALVIVDEVEAGSPQADVFWSIDASSLGYVANNDAYDPLPDEAVDSVPSDFRGSDNAWVGVAGRARSVPYNTNELSAEDVPSTVAEIPSADALGSMGWAPTYGAFKSFVTAMRIIEGEDAARQWLSDMQDAGVERFGNEYVVSQQVADGAVPAGFANHYYAMRVKNQRPDAPIDLAFTKNDAGALVDVSGALRIDGTSKGDLVNDFVRHLLSAEAQEFFATVSFAYPMIEDAAPVGGLPTIDELDPPDLDLSELSELEPTLEIMRQAGVLG